MPKPRPRAASPGPTPPVRAVEGSTNGRRRRWWLVAVAVVLVAVAATVTTVLLRDRSDREPVTSAAVFATGLSDSTVNEGDDVSVPVLTNAAAGQHVATTLHGALPRGLRLTNGTIAGTVAPTASTATKSFDITHTNPTFGSTVYSFSIEARTPDHAPTSRTLSWTVKDTELRVPDYDGTTPKSSDPLFPYRIFHVTDANACVRDHTIVGTVYRQSLRLNIPVQYGASLTLWYAADTGTCNNNISPGYGR
jgi:hypothetical protein